MILQRLPDSRFSVVERNWAGKTAVLIAGGPSLTQEQVDYCRGRQDLRCIAINDSYVLAPWADLLYAADPRWWQWHKDKLEAFTGERCSIQSSGTDVEEPVHVLRNRDHPYSGSGLSLDPGVLVSGWHGGFQALNLAILAGATRIILLGYDGKPSADGKTHFHSGHPTKPTSVLAYEQYRRAFSAAESEIVATGVQVINCSPGSAYDNFPKMELKEALDGL
jgi:hypothetical protein